MNVVFFVRDDALLKASHYKLITVKGHVHKGKWVDPFQKNVLVSDDHNDLDVASGYGSFYQKQAHKKLSKELDHFHTMHPEDKAAIILAHATDMQKEASTAAALSNWKKEAFAGKNPKPAMWEAFAAQDDATKAALMAQVNSKVGDPDHLKPPHQFQFSQPTPGDTDGNQASQTLAPETQQQAQAAAEPVAELPPKIKAQLDDWATDGYIDRLKDLADGEGVVPVYAEYAKKLLAEMLPSATQPAPSGPKMVTVEPQLGKVGPTTFPEPPDFADYAAAQAWIAARAKANGMSKSNFLASHEFAHAYPKVHAAYQPLKQEYADKKASHGAAQLAKMKAAGVKIGDTVSFTMTGAFLSSTHYEGTVVMHGGAPHVKFENEIAVSKPGGKVGYTKYLPWEPYMKVKQATPTPEPAAPPVAATQHEPVEASDQASIWSGLSKETKKQILSAAATFHMTSMTGAPNTAAKKLAESNWESVPDHIKVKVAPYLALQNPKSEKPIAAIPEKTDVKNTEADNVHIKTIGGVAFEAVKSGAIWKTKVAGADKLIEGIHADSKGGLWSKLESHHNAIGSTSFANEFGGVTEKPVTDDQKAQLDSLPWAKLMLADTNSNAKHNNAKVQAIKDAAYAGNVAALAAMKFGSNNYAQKQAKAAQAAIAALTEQTQAETQSPAIAPVKEAAPVVAATTAPMVFPPIPKFNNISHGVVAKTWLKQIGEGDYQSFKNSFLKLTGNMQSKPSLANDADTVALAKFALELAKLVPGGVTAAPAGQDAPIKIQHTADGVPAKPVTTAFHGVLSEVQTHIENGELEKLKEAVTDLNEMTSESGMAAQAYAKAGVRYLEKKAQAAGPKEGDTKTENGKTYKLIGGRWHRTNAQGVEMTPYQLGALASSSGLGKEPLIDNDFMAAYAPNGINDTAAVFVSMWHAGWDADQSANHKPAVVFTTEPLVGKPAYDYIAQDQSSAKALGSSVGTTNASTKNAALKWLAANPNGKAELYVALEKLNVVHSVISDVFQTHAALAPAKVAAPNAKVNVAKEKFNGNQGANSDSAPVSPVPNQPVQSGPQDGDTKPGADGMLVFKNGHWHKVPEENPFDAVVVPDFNAISPDKFGLAYAATAKVLKQAAEDGGVSGLNKFVTFHQDGSISIATASQKLNHILADNYKQVGNKKARMDAMFKLVMDLKAAAKAKKSGKKVVFVTSAPTAPATPAASPNIAATNVKMVAGKPPVTVIDSWVQTGPQKGSNPGGKFKDKNGQEWYCKFPATEDHVLNELLASKLYKAAGIDAPNLKIVEKDGKIGIASRFIDGVSKQGESIKKTPGALDGFAVDAWLANYDSVGTGYDNLLQKKDGTAIRIDVGGSLLYRAKGAPKGDDFGDEVVEIESMRNPSKNQFGALVFAGMSNDAIIESVALVLDVTDDTIKKLVEKYGPGTDAQKAALAEKLIARKNDLAKKYPDADLLINPPKPDPRKLVVDPAKLPDKKDFLNWNGSGKGLSSVASVNESNQKAADEIYAAALKGDLVALKKQKFKVVDKSTGAVTEGDSFGDHPSSHIKSFFSSILEHMEILANPAVKKLKKWSTEFFERIEELSELFPAHFYGISVGDVPANQRLGFWISLGEAEAAESFMPSNIHWVSSQDKINGEKSTKNMTTILKRFMKDVKMSGSANQPYRDGKEYDVSGNSTRDVLTDAYINAVEFEEGTTITKGIDFPPDMMNQMLATNAGHVFQNPGSMCCSLVKDWDSFTGNGRLKIIYAKGAKGLYNIGVGKYDSEGEITTIPGQRFMLMGKKYIDKHYGKDRYEFTVLMLPPDDTYVANIKPIK